MLVIDSSTFLAATMPDELNPAAVKLVEYIHDNGGHVPSHFFIEVTNSLNTNIKRKRIDHENRQNILAALFILPLSVDSFHQRQAIDGTVALTDQYQLTAYDAAYLELAARLKCPLATFDKKLATAASTLGLLHPAIASTGLTA